SLDGVHSSRWRLLIVMRHKLRTIASSCQYAVCGMLATRKLYSSKLRPMLGACGARCRRQLVSGGLRTAACIQAAMRGTSVTPNIASVATTGRLESHHAAGIKTTRLT